MSRRQACDYSIAKGAVVRSGFRFVSLKTVQNLAVVDLTQASTAGPNMIGVRLTSADKDVVGEEVGVLINVQKFPSVSSHDWVYL